MKMEIAQKQNISVKYRYFNMHDGRQTKVQNPITFEKWFLLGIRKYEKQGAEFELLPGLVKITWPGKPSIFRSVDNLKQEYETEYLSKF